MRLFVTCVQVVEDMVRPRQNEKRHGSDHIPVCAGREASLCPSPGVAVKQTADVVEQRQPASTDRVSWQLRPPRGAKTEPMASARFISEELSAGSP